MACTGTSAVGVVESDVMCGTGVCGRRERISPASCEPLPLPQLAASSSSTSLLLDIQHLWDIVQHLIDEVHHQKSAVYLRRNTWDTFPSKFKSVGENQLWHDLHGQHPRWKHDDYRNLGPTLVGAEWDLEIVWGRRRILHAGEGDEAA